MTDRPTDATAALASLVSLPRMGPARMRRLLDRHGDPEAAWSAVERGDVDLTDVGGAVSARAPLACEWRDQARRRTPDELIDEVHRLGQRVIDSAHPQWPQRLVEDPEPPFVLFVAGDVSTIDAVSVAIVGTRRCTSAGSSIARELGRELSRAGVTVISGLALGIDGAAHRGALDAGGAPVGVVATGLDVVYPRRHGDLWRSVAERGALVSEAAPGTTAERWRFPARNRIMAALADLVVVVESNLAGGSMLTVDSAAERGTEVMAVPGSPRVPVSSGPNQLLADGCGIVRDADDVLMALGSAVPARAATRAGTAVDAPDDPDADPVADPVADAVSFPPVALDRLVAVTGLSLPVVAARLAQLEAAGVVERVADGYQRRVR